MPIEDGMRNATKNLDKAAEAAPTSHVEHATDHEKKREDADERTRSDDQDRETEEPDDDSEG
ncbi:hypothetical protein [Brevibacterium marinum]|uniref:Ribosomal protein L12E/L44/L45/RPP1/RPP2 n=1 Tax=Brevibacterium marinum TaxID=418643 RepID=A0A846S4W1_9MICO|nr:hypothetical protein [Brevibacterium marinum]NJC58053.1 ribosomal protein L12E/L44/L45/RPP1/RPP2 [Brevibacterium marinum]